MDTELKTIITEESLEEIEKLEETKAEKFMRIVPPRVNKALEAIEKLENCAGPLYEYTEEQVTKMFTALRSKIDEVEKKYKPKEKEEKFSF